MVFVLVFERVFNIIDQTAIWKAMEEFGIPVKLTQIGRELYNEALTI